MNLGHAVVYTVQLEKFMRAVAERFKCLPSYASPDPEDGNAHIIRAIEVHQQAMRCLEDLTPGGSEFSGDPKFCAEWIKDQLTKKHEALKDKARLTKQVAENQQALQGLQARVEQRDAEINTLLIACREKDDALQQFEADNKMLNERLGRTLGELDGVRGENERLKIENDNLKCNQIPQGWICHP